jgi:hypothetical protein
MSCALCKKLVLNWMQLVYGSRSDDATVNAYWAAIEHRMCCEVCRDEALIQGSLSTYLLFVSSVNQRSE